MIRLGVFWTVVAVSFYLVLAPRLCDPESATNPDHPAALVASGHSFGTKWIYLPSGTLGERMEGHGLDAGTEWVILAQMSGPKMGGPGNYIIGPKP